MHTGNLLLANTSVFYIAVYGTQQAINFPHACSDALAISCLLLQFGLFSYRKF